MEEAGNEIVLCNPARGLTACIRFFERHLKIKVRDDDEGSIAPFLLWDAQKDLLRFLCDNWWIIFLKARQLGITWVLAGYILWRMTYQRFYTAMVVQQNLFYAKQFMDDKIKFMLGKLPRYFRPELKSDTTQTVQFGWNRVFDLDSSLLVLPATESAGRSFTGNLFFGDEATYMPSLRETYRAARPALRNANGQGVIVATSKGPIGDFFEMFEEVREYGRWDTSECLFKDLWLYKPDGEPRTRLCAVFFPWTAHPKRDEAWYSEEAQENKGDPNYMAREFPNTPDEAFTASAGRVYAQFTKKPYPDGNLHHFERSQINNLWPRYRGVDWGETRSAFVCLWAIEIPSTHPCLTIDPSCVDLIRELLSYCYDPDHPDKPLDANDHGPDALRYLVATFDIKRWLHIYREWYVFEAVALGHTTQTLCAGIRARSGWTATVGGTEIDLLGDPLAFHRVRTGDSLVWKPTDFVEDFEGTAYDRARAMLGNDLNTFDICATPHMCPGNEKLDKVEEHQEGRAMVNRLVVGALPNANTREKSTADLLREKDALPDPLKAAGVRTGEPLLEKMRQSRNREKLLRRLRIGKRIHPYYGRG